MGLEVEALALGARVGLCGWVGKPSAKRKPFLIPAPPGQSPRFKCLRPSPLDFLIGNWILYHGFYSIFI